MTSESWEDGSSDETYWVRINAPFGPILTIEDEFRLKPNHNIS